MTLIFTMLAPLLGGLLVALVPRALLRVQHVVATLASVSGLLGASVVALRFAPVLSQPQQAFDAAWIPAHGIRFTLAVDGLSLGLLWIAAFTCCLALLLRHPLWSKEVHGRGTTVALLLCQSSLAGVLCARDMMLIWVCWSIYWLAVFFLVGLRGGARRLLTSTKVALCGFCSLALMLVVFLFVAAQVRELTGQPSFAYETWMRLLLPAQQQYVCFGLLLVALALALPLLPFQGWWNDAHAQSAPVGAVVLLLGPGIYGFIRIAMPLFPLAALHAGPFVIMVAAAAALVACAAAPFESDFRRRFALTGWAQLSLAAAGAASLTPQGLSGALLGAAAMALALGGLALMEDPVAPPPVAEVETEAALPPPPAPEPKGHRLPAFFALGAALVPGFASFAAATLVLSGISAHARNEERLGMPLLPGAFSPRWLAVPLALGAVLTGMQLWAAVRAGTGHMRFLRAGRRGWPLYAVAAASLYLGIWPRVWLARSEATVGVYLSHFARRARHAVLAPDAPAHFFPDDRTPVAHVGETTDPMSSAGVAP